MRNFVFLSFAILWVACCKSEGNNLSACLDSKLETFKAEPDAVAIKTQTINGEKHYWLNNNATFYDGVEYILGENCDTVCFICGECLPPSCNEDYDSNNWEIYWEK